MISYRTLVVAMALAVLIALPAGGCRKPKAPPASAPASAPASQPATTSPMAEVAASLPATAPYGFQGSMEWNNGTTTDSNNRQADRDELAALKDQADAFTSSGQVEQAAEVYQRIVELDPTDRVSRFNLAVVMGRLRRFSQAEEIYVRLLAEQPDFIQARYNLAALYQVQGKLAQACQEWQEVVRQAPQLASAQAALGAVLLDLGQGQAAMDAYTEATKLAGDDPTVWQGLAQAARAAGNLGRAAAVARKASQLAKTDPAAWRLLGDILLDLHRASHEERFLNEAADAWRRSLELDGNQPDLRRIVDTIAPIAENVSTTRKAP